MDSEQLDIKSIASQAQSREDLWCQVINITHVQQMVEIGVWKGDFARGLLKECPSIERYYMIDPWAKLLDWNKPYNVDQKTFDDVYAEAMMKTKFAAKNLVVLRGTTKNVIDQIPDRSLDFAYIDGDHTLRGITIDLIQLLPKMKEGGLIGGDDFSNNPWQHGTAHEPTMVCPFTVYFAEAMDLPIVALPFNQFLIYNEVDSFFSFTDLTGNYDDLSLNRLPRTSGARVLTKAKRILVKLRNR